MFDHMHNMNQLQQYRQAQEPEENRGNQVENDATQMPVLNYQYSQDNELIQQTENLIIANSQ